MYHYHQTIVFRDSWNYLVIQVVVLKVFDDKGRGDDFVKDKDEYWWGDEDLP